MPVNNDFDVLILGGGIAGLFAAYEIVGKNAHIRVAIVEAKEHLGGRAASVQPFGSNLSVPVAATYLHDTKDNILLKEFPLFEEYVRSESQTVAEIMPSSVVKKDGADLPLAEQFGEIYKTDPPPSIFYQSLHSALEYGTDPYTVNAELEKQRGGDDDFLNDKLLMQGFKPLLEHLIKFLEIRNNQVAFLLGKEVACVEINLGGMFLIRAKDTKTGEETELRGNNAVLSLPIGVLQSKGVSFSEHFKPMLQSLDYLNPGFLARAIIKFEKPCWDMSKAMFYLDMEGGALRVENPTNQDGLNESNILLITFALTDKSQEAKYISDALLQEAIITALNRDVIQNGQRGELKLFNWGADKYCRGGYTTFNAESTKDFSTPKEVVDSIKQQLPKGCYIAGEFSSIDHSGTVHGAAEEGLIAGEILLRDNNQYTREMFLPSSCSAAREESLSMQAATPAVQEETTPLEHHSHQPKKHP